MRNAKQANPDPVFALIDSAVRRHKVMAVSPDSSHDRCCGDEWEAIDELVACRPSTVAGVAASLSFFGERMDREAFRDRQLMETLHANLGAALNRIAAARP